MARRGRHSADPSPRTTVEYALLGLIAIQGNAEIHGYDLGRAFADRVIGQIVRVEPGMLYHYLKKLSKDGLISSRVEQQAGRPDRQLHALTEEGSTALATWLSAPVASTREIRLEFLLKLYFARQLNPVQASRLVHGQMNLMRDRANRLENQIGTKYPSTPDNVFGATILELRHGQTTAALAWLETLPEAREEETA